MTLPPNDHSFLGDVAPDQLAALLFELASQLHVERNRRIALETALARAGVLPSGALDALGEDSEVSDKSRAELDHAMRRLLRIVTEAGGARTPLRAEHYP